MFATFDARLRRLERRRAARTPLRTVLTYADALTFAKQVGFTPDAWQEAVLRSDSRRMLLNCSRQSGKSSVSALMALHRAVFFSHSLILLVSPTLRQSGELFRKILDFLSRLPVRPHLVEETKLTMQLGNSSRIVSLPAAESNIRGYSSVSLVIEDEAARTSDELYFAMKPMLAVSNGKHVLLSSPYGRRGHFFECWENGGEEWERYLVPADQCPRIPRAFLESERQSMPARWYDSEYNCLFVEVEGAVFRAEDLACALSDVVQPLAPAAVRLPAGLPPAGEAEALAALTGGGDQ